MATSRSQVRIKRSPDDVWAVLRDPMRIVEWFPGITGVSMDGEVRTIVMASGLPVHEDIVTIDHRLRRFQYKITGPLPVSFHLATMDVIDIGTPESPESLLTYSTEIVPDPMSFVLDGATSTAIANLATILNDHAEERS
jgi:hypothetical protein